MLRIFILLPLFLLLTACGSDREQMRALSQADSLLDSKPDSALAILSGIDASSLKTEEARARRSLLMTMSLLKTGADFNGDSLLAPAYEYYGHSSKPSREAMLTHFAKGDFSETSLGELDEYDKAIALASGNGKSHYTALSYFNKASVYSSEYNFRDALEQVDSGLMLIDKINDKSVIVHGYKVKGMLLNQTGNFAKAYSVFEMGLPYAQGNDSLRDMLMLGKAYSLSLSNRHSESVELYDALWQKRCLEFTLFDICAYSLSLGMTGNADKALDVLTHLREEDDLTKMNRFYTISQIKELAGDYKGALAATDSFHIYENKAVNLFLKDTLSYSQKQLLKENALADKRNIHSKEKLHLVTVVAMIVLLCVILIVVGMLRKKWRRNLERQRKEFMSRESGVSQEVDHWKKKFYEMKIRDDSNSGEILNLNDRISHLEGERTMLNQSLEKIKDLTNANDDKDHQIAEYENMMGILSRSIDEHKAKLKELQDRLLDNFKDTHYSIARFCNHMPAIYSTADGVKTYKGVREFLISQYRDREKFRGIERQIDKLMDGVISILRSTNDLKEADIEIVIYDICGFNYTSIASLLNVSEKNASVKRSRIKDKLSKFDARYKEVLERHITMMRRVDSSK